MKNDLKRISIIAIGNGKYKDIAFPNLDGVYVDLDNIEEFFISNTSSSIFDKTQFSRHEDLKSNELREIINDYVLERSAPGDILIFYFSGHGTPIGRDDFGLVTIDTISHPEEQTTLSLSVVKISEIIKTLEIKHVIPIFIIDACYSGIINKSLVIKGKDAIESLEQNINKKSSNNFALLCSCSEERTTTSNSSGSLFTNFFIETATDGIKDAGEHLSLSKIFPILLEKVLAYTGDTRPEFYKGENLPDFPITKNSKHSQSEISFPPSYVCIIRGLWNNGKPQSKPIDELRAKCGSGVYSNNSKLALKPWGLIEKVPNTRPKQIRLTTRGIAFVEEKLSSPKKITKNSDGKWVASENTRLVYIDDISMKAIKSSKISR